VPLGEARLGRIALGRMAPPLTGSNLIPHRRYAQSVHERVPGRRRPLRWRPKSPPNVPL